MNLNIGGSFHFSSSSSSSYSYSSSNDEEEQLMTNLKAIDTEQEVKLAQHCNVTRGDSIPGHIVIDRDLKSDDRLLSYDYFTENPQYNYQIFCRHFRMDRSLFIRIVEKWEARDNYFVRRRDSVVVFRMLAYGFPADATDEYIKVRESTTIESLKRFYRVFVEEFAGTNNDTNVLEVSHLFANLAQDITPPAHYVIQGKEYNISYYLADVYTKNGLRLYKLFTIHVVGKKIVMKQE
ncbi:hypothetical protein Ddye_019064 [Dipteronia dyeriana]|uniref:Uncharacterized protein n=1 Tax=Dipteronia dyeriana TaxID=168575 RepID=A0AAD9TX31_9ROSI|nr:hypothetical protein Ddye_019064 [Dipteronia dyeriana]